MIFKNTYTILKDYNDISLLLEYIFTINGSSTQAKMNL